jgi:hypothetical protein
MRPFREGGGGGREDEENHRRRRKEEFPTGKESLVNGSHMWGNATF